MTQNIYDDPKFFDNYSQLGRSKQGLAGAAEWPALRAMLPEMSGLNVVDVGCGYGWFCRWAREAGAATVLGLDVSEKMLERARSSSSDPAVTYARADLEHLDSFQASGAVAARWPIRYRGFVAGRRPGFAGCDRRRAAVRSVNLRRAGRVRRGSP